MSNRETWFFDGTTLYAPKGVISKFQKTSWKAASGGRPGEGGFHANIEKKDGITLYKPLPNGNYKFLIKKGSYLHEWYEENSDGEMERVPYTKQPKKAQERKGGYLPGTVPSMEDAMGKNWFIPLIPTDQGNYRGLIWNRGRLGIHPDGPSKGANSHRYDGTEGCIGIQEADTSDIAELFLHLVEGKLSASSELYVEIHSEKQAHFLQENYSAYGNRPECVSILLRV
ncbi:MAG: hypothetical protein DELT_02605 [Desulfovibrio sp.]